jgi:pimeloyl-ACP methyl ester carboxylesterase
MKLAAVLGAFLVAASVASAVPVQRNKYRIPTELGWAQPDYMKSRHSAQAFASARSLPPLRLRQRCVTRAERRRVVRFRAVDKVRLIGVLLGSGPRALVLAHQGGGGGDDLCVWMPYARSLASAGYRVLAFDHRGHGSSGQASSVSRLTRVDYDVLGAIRLLRARGARAIVLAGGSLGGAAVIAAGAAATPPVQGVISFASPTSFGRVDALAAARNLHAPVLYLSADRDEGFPEAAQTLYDATPPGDKRIWVFPGTRHGAPVLRDAAVKGFVDGWIRDHLPAAGGVRLAGIEFSGLPATAPRGPT